jgi:hypothetical protein
LTKELNSSSGEKDSIFNIWCWLNWQLACRRIRVDPFLSPCTKLKSKWIHIKSVTLKLIEEKVVEEPQRCGHRGEIPEQNANDMCCRIKN